MAPVDWGSVLSVLGLTDADCAAVQLDATTLLPIDAWDTWWAVYKPAAPAPAGPKQMTDAWARTLVTVRGLIETALVVADPDHRDPDHRTDRIYQRVYALCRLRDPKFLDCLQLKDTSTEWKHYKERMDARRAPQSLPLPLGCAVICFE